MSPLQIAPVPLFGDLNGSLDLAPLDCGVAADGGGVLTVAGMKSDGWGCLPRARVNWVNLSTGRTGSAQLSAGLNGSFPMARIHTGRGQVTLMLTSTYGLVTPVFTTVSVR